MTPAKDDAGNPLERRRKKEEMTRQRAVLALLWVARRLIPPRARGGWALIGLLLQECLAAVDSLGAECEQRRHARRQG